MKALQHLKQANENLALVNELVALMDEDSDYKDSVANGIISVAMALDMAKDEFELQNELEIYAVSMLAPTDNQDIENDLLECIRGKSDYLNVSFDDFEIEIFDIDGFYNEDQGDRDNAPTAEGEIKSFDMSLTFYYNDQCIEMNEFSEGFKEFLHKKMGV